MSENKKLKVAILWHMHQPFYLHPQENRFAMPWVRFHGLKDYLDMPLLAAENGVKATFNLVPSLLDQIQMYCDGYTDRHLELSHIPAKELQPNEKKEILETFYAGHYPTMIDPYTRYRQLFRKKEGCGKDINLAIDIFSTAEWRDLQVWSNLVWIDPYFRDENLISRLFDKGRDFTEQEKKSLLDFEIELLGRIIPTYQRLQSEGKIEVSFTPYYHPIIPLLIDTDAAREAISNINLPQHRFQYPEDARWHLEKSTEKYEQLFGGKLTGMWPSEGSVSEETLKIMSELGLSWVATDEEVLKQSLLKSRLDSQKYSPHGAYIYQGAPGIKLFFRDHGLSDKIGFVYSSWSAERAVSDFINTLSQMREIFRENLDERVLPVILDGENAWEYFPNDGIDFLTGLYQHLAQNESIEIITFGEAAQSLKPFNLPSLFAGSWINHNFRIWIGHSEDNRAWDLLYDARRTLEKFQKENPGADTEKLRKAWRQIYIAEGSDWCWWYGDDHIGDYNAEFDHLFRLHLSAVYEAIDLEPPPELHKPIHLGHMESFLNMPESLLSPKIDGYLTHYYEWSGAGHYDCLKAGGAMHRVNIIIRGIHFAYDYERFYIRLDFTDSFDLVDKSNLRIVIDFNEGDRREIPLNGEHIEKNKEESASKNIFEAAFERKSLAPDGVGKINFRIILESKIDQMEIWPIDEPLALELPERDKEIFWQV